MFTLCSDLADNAAKAAKFIFAQPPFPSANSELPGALRRIFSDDTEASGMTEQRPQGANRSAGNARAAGGPTSPTFLPTARRLTGRNVRLHSRAYACQECGHHIYPCVGTPFEKSSTKLADSGEVGRAFRLMSATYSD